MKLPRSQYLKLQNHGNSQVINKSKIEINNTDEGDREFAVANASRVIRRRKNVDCFNATKSTNGTNIMLLIDNFDKSIKKINVVLEYIDMDALWLTNVYKTYENDLWHKEQRFTPHFKNKWLFHCGLCSNVYSTFCGIKTHLNLHLNLYPYVCKLCTKKYTNRKSATRHLRDSHSIQKDQYNEFLTS